MLTDKEFAQLEAQFRKESDLRYQWKEKVNKVNELDNAISNISHPDITDVCIKYTDLTYSADGNRIIDAEENTFDISKDIAIKILKEQLDLAQEELRKFEEENNYKGN